MSSFAGFASFKDLRKNFSFYALYLSSVSLVITVFFAFTSFSMNNVMLEKIGIAKYEKRVREIAFNWFAKPQAELKFDDIEEYILLSGTLGRVDVGTMINSHKTITENNKSKFSYLVSSIFPSKSEMQYKYPYVKKTPFLLPISWCHMWGKRLFVDRNINFKSGIKNRMSYTDEDVNLYKSLLDEMGFDGIGINNFGN